MLEERTFSPTSFDLTNRFRLDLMAASRRYDQAFLLGGWSDDDDAGWLLEDMETNLARCIAEKTRKIAPYRARYPLWWLLLVDHVGYGLDPFDQSLFRDQVTVDHDFNRVILVDPLHPARGFDI
jgi:hypothetical protein